MSMLAEMDPTVWEGAAYQMGNTPQTWQAHYAPQKRLRDMQAAVAINAAFIERVREGQGPVDPIMMVGGNKRKKGGPT